MKWTLFAGLVMLWPVLTAAQTRAPLHDPTYLNIGLSCKWQQNCIAKQKKAMASALKYVKKNQPPNWRIHLCNRNAARSGYRVDWVGFDNCIRNASLRQPPPKSLKKRARVSTYATGPISSALPAVRPS